MWHQILSSSITPLEFTLSPQARRNSPLDAPPYTALLETSILAPKWSWVRPASPTFLQSTVFETSIRGHAVIVGSRSPEASGHRRAGMGAYFLKMTRARIAALPAEQMNMRPVSEKTERPVQPSLM